jgi:DNA-binding transcriptional ArsR family regulator
MPMLVLIPFFPLRLFRHFHIFENMKSGGKLPLAKPAVVAGLKAAPVHVEAFKALAHLTRLQVFFFVVRSKRDVTVGEIQEALGVPGPTLSHHLDQLCRSGLIRRRRAERFVYCSVDRDLLTDLVRLLTACC